MGQSSDLLASAPVGLRGAVRDSLRLRTSVVVAGPSEISSAVSGVEEIRASVNHSEARGGAFGREEGGFQYPDETATCGVGNKVSETCLWIRQEKGCENPASARGLNSIGDLRKDH